MIFRSYIKMSVLYRLKSESLSGYDLMKKIGMIEGKKPSAGYMYPLLQELLEKKFVSLKEQGRKKNYMITKKGLKLLDDLRNSSEETVKNMSSILRPISEKEELENYLSFHTKMKKFKIHMIQDMDVFEKFADAWFEVYDKNDASLSDKARKILIRSTKELKKL